MVQAKRKRDESIPELPKAFKQRHTKDFNEACQHILKVDPSLLATITSHDFPLFLVKEQEQLTLNHHFAKLASSIIAQQISGNAAKSIKKRVVEYFGNEFPTYQKLHDSFQDTKSVAGLRECGLSQRKISYLESLAMYFHDNEKEIEVLFTQDDDKIVEELVKNIKGIGPWSAKMFLVTSLERMDVFAADDLGVARGCSKYLESRPEVLKSLKSKRTLLKKSKIKHKNMNWKIHDEDIVESCGQLFEPYGTVFMFILWRLSSTNVEVMAKNEKEFATR